MRLNKVLSAAGVSSRRVADELISQGRVDVNGRVVTTLGIQVNPAVDDIRVDGRRLRKVAPERRYLLMNKPSGVMSTRVDPQQRPTVIDVLAKAGVRGYFYPVGRLDYESEGLIILTNDGEFAERVSHPRYELERTYEVEVAGVPDERDLGRLERGVLVDGRKTLPARVRMLKTMESRRGPRAIFELTLREGRNRQVRKMCEAIGHRVTQLKRIAIGPIRDRTLRTGQWRELRADEVAKLRAASERTQDRATKTRKRETSKMSRENAKPRNKPR